jgi:hypothetical protein
MHDVPHESMPYAPTSLAQMDIDPALVDSSIGFPVLPFGVDHRNETVVGFWAGDRRGRAVPSAKITLLVSIHVGANFPVPKSDADLEQEFQVFLGLNSSFDARLNKVLAYGLSSAYTINIGAGAHGHWTLQGCVMYQGRAVALGGTEFFTAPVRSSMVTSPPTTEAHSVAASAAASHGRLFGAMDVSADVSGDASAPPATVPMELLSAFTMEGGAALYHWYMDEKTSPEKSYQSYTREAIDRRVERARRREHFYYGLTDTFLYESLDRHPVASKTVLIVGSNVPVYESICIAAGARHCVTLEYNALDFRHPRTHTFTVEEWRHHVVTGTSCVWPREEGDSYSSNEATRGAPYNCRFDAVWSISSLEHDGLGRYGDPISPDADLAAMAKLRDFLVSTGGLMYLSVPAGEDAVHWNSGRVYGAKRLVKLLDGWSVVGTFGLPREAATAPSEADRAHALTTALEMFRFGGWGDAFEPVFVLSPRRGA